MKFTADLYNIEWSCAFVGENFVKMLEVEIPVVAPSMEEVGMGGYIVQPGQPCA